MLKKLQRTITSILPVADGRQGQCVGCGACCKLAVDCPFLKKQSDGRSICSIYSVRPLNCRKYPRSNAEHITQGSCGYKFANRTTNK